MADVVLKPKFISVRTQYLCSDETSSLLKLDMLIPINVFARLVKQGFECIACVK